MIFTVKSTMPTGKTDPKFGSEFYVQFNETEQAFPLWFKTAPDLGKEIEGEINNGKFKKVKKEWNPNGQGATATPGGASVGTQPAQPGAKPAWKDNSDGMRQGMCFNNAANFVNTLQFPQTLTDREWADTVFAYAQALYLLGDLNQTPVGNQEDQVADNVTDLFGPVQKVAVPRS
jgi:hypothetical protein